MTTATTSANVDRAVRTQLEYEVKDAFGSGDRVAVEPLTDAQTDEESND